MSVTRRTSVLRRWSIVSATAGTFSLVASVITAGFVPDVQWLHWTLRFAAFLLLLTGLLIWERADPAYDYRHLEPDGSAAAQQPAPTESPFRRDTSGDDSPKGGGLRTRPRPTLIGTSLLLIAGVIVIVDAIVSGSGQMVGMGAALVALGLIIYGAARKSSDLR